MPQGTILPARLAQLAKGQTIPNTLKAKTWVDEMNKVLPKIKTLQKASDREPLKALRKNGIRTR